MPRRLVTIHSHRAQPSALAHAYIQHAVSHQCSTCSGSSLRPFQHQRSPLYAHHPRLMHHHHAALATAWPPASHISKLQPYSFRLTHASICIPPRLTHCHHAAHSVSALRLAATSLPPRPLHYIMPRLRLGLPPRLSFMLDWFYVLPFSPRSSSIPPRLLIYVLSPSTPCSSPLDIAYLLPSSLNTCTPRHILPSPSTPIVTAYCHPCHCVLSSPIVTAYCHHPMYPGITAFHRFCPPSYHSPMLRRPSTCIRYTYTRPCGAWIPILSFAPQGQYLPLPRRPAYLYLPHLILCSASNWLWSYQ